MRILLIMPASGKWRGIARYRFFNGRFFRFSALSLLTLAELSPADADVRIVDEQIEPVPFDEPFDLVGITCMTATAPRAYELAATFRERDIPVVLGGFHPTLNPKEATQHADAVVVGSACGAWEALIRDLRLTGRLRPVYHGDPAALPPSRLPRHLLRRRGYQTTNAVAASMGCRNNCRFCSIRAFHKGRHTARPPREVASEVAELRGRQFMMVDDNLTQDRAWAMELFERLAPLQKRWVTQVPVDTADDLELLDAMRRAGCVGVFVGLETFDRGALLDQNKDIRAPERYREAVRRFHAHGMFVLAGMIFGFDSHRPEVFRDTLRMVEEIGIDAVQISILTPLPGTELHADMDDRIFDRDLEHYDYRHVVFEPAGMTARELKNGADWAIQRFYSPLAIARRALRWLGTPGGWRQLPQALGINLAYYGRVLRFGIRGYDPARGRVVQTVPTSPEKRTCSRAA